MVSIVIPAHNECENLRQLLPQLLQLSLRDGAAEVLPVLSASTADGCAELIASLGLPPLRASADSRAAQMNLGAQHARGQVLAFLHADVRPPDGFLEDIRGTLDAGYRAGFFSYRFEPETFWLRLNGRATRRDGIFTGGGDQCLFIAREDFLELGGFDQEQLLMEDFEFFRRLKRSGLRYRIVPNDLQVSARKYERNSYLRVNLSNLLLLTLFRCGYPPARLKRLHARLIRPAHNSVRSDSGP